MDRRGRNRLCVWLICIGLVNFILYAAVYAFIGGDAQNGGIRDDGSWYVRGHHVHRIFGYEQDVPKWVWIYSYIHSISIWPSIALVLLAMLMLARPHIVATYQQGIVQGATLVTVMATVIIFVTSIIMFWFIVGFVRTLMLAR
ncbi:MAG TPA: hypothetical protein VMV94_12240 [Phycisphaerae bacterium]|nr:hypothetical protein [Phycisphaerae bacterium]